MAESKQKCPHCGKLFRTSECKGGIVPTHDFPPPCRSVCRGSGQHPRSESDKRPLWKDDEQQEAKDFWDEARGELRIYGFAVAKEMAARRMEKSGTMPCPLCLGPLKFSIAESNGHMHARCPTKDCINAME